MHMTVGRRKFLQLASLTALDMRWAHGMEQRPPVRLLFGTKGPVSKGIYSADWNGETGEVGPIALMAEIANPTFLAQRAQSDSLCIYAVSEVDGPGARVTAFTLNADRSALHRLNDALSLGDGPTYLSLNPEGNCLFVANYDGGSVTSYQIDKRGDLSQPVSHFQYQGHGPNKDRQETPHAHSATSSPDGRYLLVNDLGLDRIVIYRIHAETGKLIPHLPVWTARSGSGPRHLVFHPNGRWVYSVNELDSTVDVLLWDAHRGSLHAMEHVSTLPPNFPPNTAFAGEIALSRDGRHVYVGNRIAENSIAVFDVNDATGGLTLKQLADNGGKTTRHIALDPTERWMIVSNQETSEVVVLSRNKATGRLSPPRHRYPLDTVMFAMFV